MNNYTYKIIFADGTELEETLPSATIRNIQKKWTYKGKQVNALTPVFSITA